MLANNCKSIYYIIVSTNLIETGVLNKNVSDVAVSCEVMMEGFLSHKVAPLHGQ